MEQSEHELNFKLSPASRAPAVTVDNLIKKEFDYRELG